MAAGWPLRRAIRRDGPRVTHRPALLVATREAPTRPPSRGRFRRTGSLCCGMQWLRPPRKIGVMADQQKLDALLRALGADKPSYRRRWTPEGALSNIFRDRHDLVEAIERLARDSKVLLRARGAGRNRQWLLERCGPLGVRSSSCGRLEMEPVDLFEETDNDEEFFETEPTSLPLPHEPPARITRPGPAETRLGPPVGRPVRRDNERRALDPQNSNDVRQLLRELGIGVTDDGPPPRVSPGGIQHHLDLLPGTRMEALRRRLEDITRGLGCEAHVSALPGQRFVALDLVRPDRQIAPLVPALELLPSTQSGALWLPIGMTPDGGHRALDLATLPHLLIAGATGTGKSVLLLCLMLALVLRLSPEDLELLLIDIKTVDFGCLAGQPHLRAGAAIDDVDLAVTLLQELAGPELEKRTEILRQAGCANLAELQTKHPGHGVKRTVVVVDELGDLMTILSRDERREFERGVLRLAQRARAVGIHLVIATQRPTREFITGAIKANLPCRISLRLPQRSDSAVILDQPGAERLSGMGDMLLLHNGQMERLQGYYVDVRTPEALASLRGTLRTRST